MRIPQYQAWHKANKKMYHVALLYADVNTVMLRSSDSLFSATFDEIELREFTFIAGKRRKHIFEGDIVKGTNGIGYVKYEYGSYRVQFLRYWTLLSDDIFEVIGNIYENPDLLEERVQS